MKAKEPLEGDEVQIVDLSDNPPLESEQEVKEGKALKIVSPNKLIISIPVLLAQMKAGNNLFKLKSKVRQILYLPINSIKSVKKNYKNLINSL